MRILKIFLILALMGVAGTACTGCGSDLRKQTCANKSLLVANSSAEDISIYYYEEKGSGYATWWDWKLLSTIGAGQKGDYSFGSYCIFLGDSGDGDCTHKFRAQGATIGPIEKEIDVCGGGTWTILPN